MWDIAHEVSTGTLTATSVLLFIVLWGIVAWGQVQWWQRLRAERALAHPHSTESEGSASDHEAGQRARAARRATLVILAAGSLILLAAIIQTLNEARGGQITIPTLLVLTLCALVLIPSLMNQWRNLRRVTPSQAPDESSRSTSGDDGEEGG